MYVLGRSGTVSAAVEAAFFGVPAIAVSMYMREEQFGEPTAVADYEHAVDATTHLAHDAVTDGIFDTADYLNVNAPTRTPTPPARWWSPVPPTPTT